MELTEIKKEKTDNLGSLFVIGTPIGNLEDISSRAIETLRSVDLIAAEDTRRTRKIVNRFSIPKPLASYHDFNKSKKAPWLIQKLLSGDSIALVSDAGTPGISDPGYYLIRLALDNSIPVIPIPGPSAIIAGLSISGLPTDRFVFEGFVEARGNRRKKQLERLKDEERTIILFESPYRIVRTLEDILEILGNRRICIARELTKIHEEVLRGEVETIVSVMKKKKTIKGEITICIQGIGKK